MTSNRRKNIIPPTTALIHCRAFPEHWQPCGPWNSAVDVFLPSGDAELARRARKHSKLSAVILKWSKARKHYERQGLLVENEALELAELACAADAETRATRHARATIRQKQLDQSYIARFAARIRELFPHCPDGREGALQSPMPPRLFVYTIR